MAELNEDVLVHIFDYLSPLEWAQASQGNLIQLLTMIFIYNIHLFLKSAFLFFR